MAFPRENVALWLGPAELKQQHRRHWLHPNLQSRAAALTVPDMDEPAQVSAHAACQCCEGWRAS
jgi:hypothetical protein